jgi:pimeloyl-ACP methyl ester carboxylesterase
VSASAPVPASTLPPLRGEWLERLPLKDFGDAVVAVPFGATSPRPVLIGAHGRGDRPEWACGEWRGATDAHPFILCPHGVPVRASPGQGLSFAGADRLKREIDAGLEALRARFGRYVADGPMIFAGFSQGAFLGVAVAADDPKRFPVVVLGEGGQSTWTADRAARFAQGGGVRVLFVCSTGACDAATKPALLTLQREGVEAKMISAGHIGHLVDDRVVAVIRQEWPWVVRDRAGALGPW